MRIYFRYKSLNLILCNLLKMQRVRILLLGVFSILLGGTLRAQEFYPSQRTWDKTRIQYQKFSWKYLSNQNFEVYYFGKNETLARTTLQILDADFQRMTSLLSYTPFQKQGFLSTHPELSLHNRIAVLATRTLKRLPMRTGPNFESKLPIRTITRVIVRNYCVS